MGSNPIAVTWTSDIMPVLRKDFVDIKATIESGFAQKPVRDMIRTYNGIIVLYELINVIFGINQKPPCFKSSKLPRKK